MDQNDEFDLQELFERAMEYRDFARRNFTLEITPMEEQPEFDDIGKGVNMLRPFMSRFPHLFAPSVEYVIHYLFPCLNDSERKLLVHLHFNNDSYADSKMNAESTKNPEEVRKNCREALERQLLELAQARKAVQKSGLERKLTVLQLSLLECDFFDCNSQVESGYF